MTVRWNWQPDAPDWPWDDSDVADAPVVRCLCSHAPSVHTGGYGRCHIFVCACQTYRDPDPLAAAMQRHPAGKATPRTGDIA